MEKQDIQYFSRFGKYKINGFQECYGAVFFIYIYFNKIIMLKLQFNRDFTTRWLRELKITYLVQKYKKKIFK